VIAGANTISIRTSISPKRLPREPARPDDGGHHGGRGKLDVMKPKATDVIVTNDQTSSVTCKAPLTSINTILACCVAYRGLPDLNGTMLGEHGAMATGQPPARRPPLRSRWRWPARYTTGAHRLTGVGYDERRSRSVALRVSTLVEPSMRGLLRSRSR